MRALWQKKYLFSGAISIIFVVLLVVYEQEITAFTQVFEKSTLISLGLYAMSILLATEFFLRLFTKKIAEQSLAFVLAAALGVFTGFVGMLVLQVGVIRLLS